jgi:hypothetical protein
MHVQFYLMVLSQEVFEWTLEHNKADNVRWLSLSNDEIVAKSQHHDDRSAAKDVGDIKMVKMTHHLSPSSKTA